MPKSAYMYDFQLAARFLMVMLVGWIFLRFVPIKWFVDYYLPMSFHLLNLLLVLGVMTQGWPFMHPTQRPEQKAAAIIPRGTLQTALWLGLGIAFHAIGRHAVGMPDPGGVYFGITLFMCTLWYSLGGVGPFPFGDRLKPWENGLFGWGTIMALSIGLFLGFVNFKGLPIEGHRTDPNGQIAAQEWFDRCVWIIVWIQAFGSIMCFQGWPFILLKAPWYQISLLGACIGLGTACWEVTLAANIDQATSAAAVGATMISFTLYHAIGFELRPFASRFVQPTRGVLNFVLEEVLCTLAWVFFCRGVLEPVAERLLDAGPPYSFFNVNHLTAWYSLHVVAPLLIVHENFFARFPMPAPGPPIGPFELAKPAAEATPAPDEESDASAAMSVGDGALKLALPEPGRAGGSRFLASPLSTAGGGHGHAVVTSALVTPSLLVGSDAVAAQPAAWHASAGHHRWHEAVEMAVTAPAQAFDLAPALSMGYPVPLHAVAPQPLGAASLHAAPVLGPLGGSGAQSGWQQMAQGLI